jgi:N-acetylglucosamine kinase-like BadF-type ATPase
LNGIVVGIDAGASKTRAFAVDRAGTVVGRGAGGGGNLLTSPDPQGASARAGTRSSRSSLLPARSCS